MNFGTMLDGWMDGYAVIISVDSDFSVSHLFEGLIENCVVDHSSHHIVMKLRTCVQGSVTSIYMMS